VERVADIAYGEAGKANRLDVYRRRGPAESGPMLLYFHGGGFTSGGKSREARPLLYRLASEGWVCASANYRLAATPGEGFPEHLIDVKKVIGWAREHGAEYGGDPSVVVVAGSSAGAHLAAMAALTPCDPGFQPGFEDVDTSVDGAVCLYGYYGELGGESRIPTSPVAHVRGEAPPFFVAHGDNDTYTSVEGARSLVARLRDASSQPVVYAELPGAQHSFDLFYSARVESVIGGVEAFTTAVRSEPATRTNWRR
jgi:acetyl esterase/lipase